MHPRTPPSRLTATEVFDDDHRTLLALVARLSGKTNCSEVRQVWLDVRSELRRHLDDEEMADGLFDWLAMLRPRLAPQIADLRSDHSMLRQGMDHIDSALYDDDDVALCLAIELLNQTLRLHEQKEREAVNAALS